MSTPAQALHERAAAHNWDDGLEELTRILDDAACDQGTALLIFWRGAPTFYTRWATSAEYPPEAQDVGRLLRTLEDRLLRRDFSTRVIAFDPRDDGGIDRTVDNGSGVVVRPIPAELYAALGGIDQAAAELVKVLKFGVAPVRADAALRLGTMDCAVARAALVSALRDMDVMVRVHAWNGTLRQAGLTDFADEPCSRLGVLKAQLLTDLPSVFGAAAAALGELVAAKARGEAPDLAAAPAPAALVERVSGSLDSDVAAYDVEAARQLTGRARAWAEALFVGGLVRRDVRAVAAVVALAIARGDEALADAVARSTDDEFNAACRQAIAAWGSRRSGGSG